MELPNPLWCIPDSVTGFANHQQPLQKSVEKVGVELATHQNK